MNQQAFAGGMASPFLPISLPAGVPTPPGIPYAPPSHQSHHSNSMSIVKEEHSDNDQVRQQ